MFCLQRKVIQGETLSPKDPLKARTSSDGFSEWTRSPTRPQRSLSCPRSPVPGVNDLSPLPIVLVIVQDDVAVPAVELPVRGGVHRHLLGAFYPPDLAGEEQRRCRTSPFPARVIPKLRIPEPAVLPRPLPGLTGQFPSAPRAGPQPSFEAFRGVFKQPNLGRGRCLGFWTAPSPFKPNSSPASMLKVMNSGAPRH